MRRSWEHVETIDELHISSMKWR